MMDFIFSFDRFMPHGHCYLWRPDLVALHVVSDGLIALAYASIPITLIYFIRKRDDIPFSWVFWCFGVFIIACGVTHALSIWTLWVPAYWISGFIKALTAIISVITAVLLIKLVPKALALPSPEQLRRINEKLSVANKSLIVEIAERKRIEKDLEESHLALKENQVQLVQAEKLASVGQLAAGIAHEINTPIQYIGDNIHFLQSSFNQFLNLVQNLNHFISENSFLDDEKLAQMKKRMNGIDFSYVNKEIPKAISQSLEGIKHVSVIVNAMKDFSHPGPKEKTTLDLNQALATTITVARNEWRYFAEMKTDFCSELPLIPMLPNELNQAFLNLIINAAHSIEEKQKQHKEMGLIEIVTRKIENEVEVRISDSGMGIPSEIQGKIFDPFFTTKEVGKGTGQGLALVYSTIVGLHGGRISFETKLGEGTTFIIHLPIS